MIFVHGREVVDFCEDVVAGRRLPLGGGNPEGIAYQIVVRSEAMGRHVARWPILDGLPEYRGQAGLGHPDRERQWLIALDFTSMLDVS